MARIAFLIKQPKRALGALAVLVAATGVVVGSGANFSASSANPDNSFSAGTLSIVNSKEAAAILTADDLEPGGAAATGVVDIHNSGSLAGVFELSRSAIVDSDVANPMSAKLNLVVTDCGAWTNVSTVNPCGDADDQVIYGASTSTIAGMTGAVALGQFDPDEKHRYQFEVQLDSSATDAYQGDTSSVQFDWDAVQS